MHQGRANVSKKELQGVLAKQFKVQDPNQVYVFGLRSKFGGGKSTGFALVYDSVDVAKKLEPKYRLVRVRFPHDLAGLSASIRWVAYHRTLGWSGNQGPDLPQAA